MPLARSNKFGNRQLKTVVTARLRRVTADEDPALHKARVYTTAAAGKFTDRSKLATQRQYQTARAGGASPEQAAEARAPHRTPEQADRIFRANQTRKLTRDMKQNSTIEFPPSDILEDRSLIKKFKSEGGFGALDSVERERFTELFKRYPPDLVRTWLGSSEQSRARRNQSQGTVYTDRTGTAWRVVRGVVKRAS